MKEYLYTLGIVLLATLSACSDSDSYQGPEGGNESKGGTSIKVELSQKNTRLLFEKGPDKIITKFQNGADFGKSKQYGDKIYLFDETGSIVNHQDGQPAVFYYENMDGNFGIFGLNFNSEDDSEFLTTKLTTGEFNAILVGANMDDPITASSTFDSTVITPSNTGVQTGSGDMANLETTAGIFKSTNEISFTQKDILEGSDHFNFSPDYAIIEVNLSTPTTFEKDLVIPSSYPPGSLYFTLVDSDDNDWSFQVELKDFDSWDNSKVYVPVVASEIKQILIIAGNDTDGDMQNNRTYWYENVKDQTIGKGMFYSLSPDLSGELYLRTLDSNPSIVKYVAPGSILTLWDGDGTGGFAEGKTTIASFNGNLKAQLAARQTPIGFNFPLLTEVPSSTTDANGCFYGVQSLYHLSFPLCTSVGARAFKNCNNLEFINLPSCYKLETGFLDVAKDSETADMKIILGTEVPESLSTTYIARNIFLYRFGKLGNLMDATYTNTYSGVIAMDLGYRLANNKKNDGSIQTQGGMRVTASVGYTNSPIQPGGTGRFWYTYSQGTGNGNFGWFQSILIVPYPDAQP